MERPHQVRGVEEVGGWGSEDYGLAGLVEGEPAGICYALCCNGFSILGCCA